MNLKAIFKITIFKKYLGIGLYYFLILLSTKCSFAQSPIISNLNKYVVPVNKLNVSDTSFSDIARFASVLSQHRIIALGEATHGTNEFLQTKLRMIRYMISELSYKVIIFEASFSGAQLMNDYVLFGKGNPYDAFRAMSLGSIVNQDVLNTVEWIKEYNSKKAFSEKVRIYGCDLASPVEAAKMLRNESIPFQIPLSETCKHGLDLLMKWNYKKLSKEEKALVNQTISELHTNTISLDNPELSRLYARYIVVLEQYTNFVTFWPMAKHNLRDKAMADNCRWIIDSDSSKKVILWAHNGHIAKVAWPSNDKPMGQHLSETYGNNYYAMAFSFNFGTVRAVLKPSIYDSIIEVPKVESSASSEFIFSQLNEPNFFLDFQSSAANKEVENFLNRKLYSRCIGAVYFPSNSSGKDIKKPLIKLYDGMVFFKEAVASPEPLPYDSQ